jgi:prephenate dehydrogenase
MTEIKNISIIGLGLIGGSIARGLKRSKNQIKISAYDKHEIILKALNDGTIDYGLNSVEESIESDFIFLCLPIELSLEVFDRIMPMTKENTIVTDVCGIKGVLEDKRKNIKSKGIYIGGHPMTGKEKGGYENSDELLFENAVYILSDTEKENPKIKDLTDIIKLLGARIIFLNPYVHDKVVANVSHIPQLLAVVLVNSASKKSNEINNLDFAAGGFRDMTRIASSDFNIWESILKLNKKEILHALSALQNEIDDIRRYLINDALDKLKDKFISASVTRDEIPKNTKGFMSPLFDVFVFVNDQPGMISKISTALFKAGINIKDIELLKIREGAGGNFRLAFESENDAQKAKIILKEIGFTIN